MEHILIIPFASQRLFKVLKWVSGGDSAAFDKSIEPDPMKNLAETNSLDQADIVTSEFMEHYSPPGSTSRHMVMFDVDIPMTVIESSTPGHHHVYFPNTLIPKDKFFNLLDALADAGIVERGYSEAAKHRGFAALRLPWVSKRIDGRAIRG